MAETTRYTPLGCGIWMWKPFVSLGNDARILWLVLYTSPEAKRSVPGLWPGSAAAMSDAARMDMSATWNALNDLVDRKLVEFDGENRLARLTQFPDSFDRAHTWQAINGWWTRFKGLPQCPLRDAHVVLLQWLVQQGKCEKKMAETWASTFGTIVIPTHSPLYLPPGSSDTSTDHQLSLYGPTSIPESPSSCTSKEIRDSDEVSYQGASMTASMAPTKALGWERERERERDLDLDRVSGSGGEGGRVRLQLVPDPTPEETAGELRVREMREAILAAGGEHLLPAKKKQEEA